MVTLSSSIISGVIHFCSKCCLALEQVSFLQTHGWVFIFLSKLGSCNTRSFRTQQQRLTCTYIFRASSKRLCDLRKDFYAPLKISAHKIAPKLLYYLAMKTTLSVKLPLKTLSGIFWFAITPSLYWLTPANPPLMAAHKGQDDEASFFCPMHRYWYCKQPPTGKERKRRREMTAQQFTEKRTDLGRGKWCYSIGLTSSWS